MVRTETCRALLRRAHRHLLNSAIMVSLMGHTAVQTSVAEGFLAAQVGVVGLKRTWDQMLSSCLMSLTLMTTHLFHFRVADTEEC